MTGGGGGMAKVVGMAVVDVFCSGATLSHGSNLFQGSEAPPGEAYPSSDNINNWPIASQSDSSSNRSFGKFSTCSSAPSSSPSFWSSNSLTSPLPLPLPFFFFGLVASGFFLGGVPNTSVLAVHSLAQWEFLLHRAQALGSHSPLPVLVPPLEQHL